MQIDAPCLCCGELMRVVVRDGVIESRSQAGICGYVDIPLREWATDWPFT